MFRPNDDPVPGYRLERMLGRGGFGEVWQAVGPGRTPSALKFIGLCGRPGIREFRAIQKVKEIRHAHLMPIHALWILDDQNNVIDDSILEQMERAASSGETSNLQPSGAPSTFVVAMMLADMSLMDLLQRYQAHKLPGIPPLELLRYLEDSARGIDFLNGRQHDLGNGPISVQHCDIKPHNIVLVGDSAMVCDFGLARVLDEGHVTTGIFGTPAYMAPECIRGTQLSNTTDQYSLAITYYHLRCGVVPFAANTTQRDMMSIHVDGGLDLSRVSGTERKILTRATSIQPNERFPTALEMVKELQGCSFTSPRVSIDVRNDDAIWNTLPARDVDREKSTKGREYLELPETHAEDDEYPFGADLRMVLLAAAASMKRTNWNVISTVHLWIGMTYIDGGLLNHAMLKRGIVPSEVRGALRRAIRQEPSSDIRSAVIFSDNAEAAFSTARRLARRAGAGRVRERHLLQAILDTPDASANLVLELIGMDRSHFSLDVDDGSSNSGESLDDGGESQLDVRANREVFDQDGWLVLACFDENCCATLEASRRATEEMGQTKIRTPHLFLGALERGHSEVAMRLHRADVDVPELTNMFRMLVANVSGNGPGSVELRRDSFSDNSFNTLQEAVRSSATQGCEIVSELEFLRTLLDGESVVSRTLEINGVDSDLLFR